MLKATSLHVTSSRRHSSITKKSCPQRSRPDSSGMRVEALAAQNLATRIRTNSRETHCDERVITVLS